MAEAISANERLKDVLESRANHWQEVAEAVAEAISANERLKVTPYPVVTSVIAVAEAISANERLKGTVLQVNPRYTSQSGRGN